MAKCKRSSKRPQPEHKQQKKSRQDKRERLQHRNAKRKKTTKAKGVVTWMCASSTHSLARRARILAPRTLLEFGGFQQFDGAAGLLDQVDQFLFDHFRMTSISRPSSQTVTIASFTSAESISTLTVCWPSRR